MFCRIFQNPGFRVHLIEHFLSSQDSFYRSYIDLVYAENFSIFYLRLYKPRDLFCLGPEPARIYKGYYWGKGELRESHYFDFFSYLTRKGDSCRLDNNNVRHKLFFKSLKGILHAKTVRFTFLMRFLKILEHFLSSYSSYNPSAIRLLCSNICFIIAFTLIFLFSFLRISVPHYFHWNLWVNSRFFLEYIHAVLLEDVNCTKKGAGNLCQNTLDTVLDYNEKSLAPFDGIDIDVNSSAWESSEENAIDYRALFETADKEAKENVSISASLPLNYTASQIKEIAPFVDFFIIRAYPGENKKLNSVSNIVDAVALEMGEIRGAGSRGIIEISVGEGFKDKYSIQQLFTGLADYYSNDSAFLGVSIFNYNTYKGLPQTQTEEKEFPIPGFNTLAVILAGLGAFALLKEKRS